MKRILGTVVAIAGVLAFSTAAMAATVVFDVTGDAGYWNKVTDANAGIPEKNGGPCPASFSPSVGGGCFQTVFEAGSSITVDITGNSVTMLGGTLNLHIFTPLLFDSAVEEWMWTDIITAGATGTLVGDSILWSTPANYSMTPFPSSWVNCTGSNCGALSHPGVPIPIHPYLDALTNTTLTTALDLGTWNLNADHTDITGSTVAMTAWLNVVEEPNRRQAGYTFGSTVLVPEPGSAALILLGLGALALRSRKA